jgi:hypothetical protein
MGERSKQQASREQRRAAALRENLKRRKAQARGRAAEPDAKPAAPPADARGKGR